MDRWMRERLELLKAIKESPYHLKEGECDYVPPLELVGIYIAHTAITRMAHRGEIDLKSAVFINAALGTHSFCVLHHCTHESISQHSPEHEKFENMVFRLACAVIFFDDGYKVAHRKHHQRANKEDDPDLILSHSSLPTLGYVIRSLAVARLYSSIGAPIRVYQADILRSLGLIGELLLTPTMERMIGAVEWKDMTLKLASFNLLDTLEENAEYKALSKTLQATWRDSFPGTAMLLALFFARYPHRNGKTMENEVDSYYDNTFRGEEQTDLWMMGEGPHHLHHAKADVSYARLGQICNDIDRRHPHLNVVARGNGDARSLEEKHELPPTRNEGSQSSMMHAAERTEQIEELMNVLSYDAVEAVKGFARVAIENAIRCCVTSDTEYLREVHQKMELPKGQSWKEYLSGAKKRAIPFGSLGDTIFAESTSENIKENSDYIVSQVLNLAEDVGKKIPTMKNGEEIKENYFSFFVALNDSLFSHSEQERFMKLFLRKLGARKLPSTFDFAKNRDSMIQRFQAFLESPVPADFTKDDFDINMDNLNEQDIRLRVAEIISGPAARL